MTSDDSQFLDVLASVPHNFGQWLTHLPFAETINGHFDAAGKGLRHSLEQATWLPDSIRPRPPKPSPRLLHLQASHSRDLLTGTLQWLVDYSIILCPVAAFFGTGALLYYRRRKLFTKKRRAKRTAKGARVEAVVVAGNPHSPYARSIILDLERRGYVVYVTTNGVREEAVVKEEGKQDIMPLHINVNDPLDVDNSVSQFKQVLRHAHSSSLGPEAHELSFAGLILITDVTYPAGPVETISSELWSDAMSTKVLGTIATARAFIQVLAEHQSRLVIATPTIIPSIRPAFQSVESTIVGALDGFIDSLRSELATLGVPLCQLRLGSFDCSSIATRHSLSRNTEQEVLFWSPHARTAYASNFLKQEKGLTGSRGVMHGIGLSGTGRGSPLRELNNAVFDCLTVARPPSMQRVGRGSLVYATVGAIVPASLVRWMMGMQPAQAYEATQRRSSDTEAWAGVSKEV